MPTAPRRPCTQPGCPQLQPCPVHVRDTSIGYGHAGTKRIRGRKLQAMRARLFQREPWCRACKERLATIRDHVIPLSEGGKDDETNEQPLCQMCSDAKTQAEARRGQQRAR